MSEPSAPVARPPCPPFRLSWVELGFIILLLAGGFCFLRDAPHWGRNAYVGSAQFGDAEFWWNGALHFSQGIVADNPNLNYRMGYAVFGGSVAAVIGPDYRLFQKILVVIFLITAAACYLSLSRAIGRIAAAAAVLFFVFNPYTAEWLAISTSDALGLILNLVALLALAAGVRNGAHLRWLALAGIFLACASLTRPLMTPFIVPAALVVLVAAWPDKRRSVRALAVLFAAFVLPTFAWMSFMRLTTGNFAISGAGQDAASFYAASDPQIQVWRSDMYAAVNAAAQKHYGVTTPTARQLNAEFWAMTRANYAKHWRYHAGRAWHHLKEIARFTPARATMTSPETDRWRLRGKWILVAGLVAAALRRQRQWSAIFILGLGALWIYVPGSGPWLVLAGSAAGLAALFFRRGILFAWTSYWWVGVAALYLVGGTWGAPTGGPQDLNALGYRLGFQFFFANDLLIAGLLGCLSLGAAERANADDGINPLFYPSLALGRFLRLGLLVLLVALAGLLGTGAVIVAYRLVTRGHTSPVAYPDPAALARLPIARDATFVKDFATLGAELGKHDNRPLLAQAMSSGFIWNMPGQERSMLLVYQQDNLRPVTMSPRQHYLEVSRHLPERQWMNRQGAWLLRSFPNTAQVSNLPYYFEMPAIQAFVPLTADGRAYDVDHAVTFPLAKTATQLVAGNELTFAGPAPEWSLNSGPLPYARRFALRAGPAGWSLDLSPARGQRSFSFSIQREAAREAAPLHLQLATHEGEILWQADLAAGAAPVAVRPVLPAGATGLRFTSPDLATGDTLWFYELVLMADDFTQ